MKVWGTHCLFVHVEYVSEFPMYFAYPQLRASSPGDDLWLVSVIRLWAESARSDSFLETGLVAFWLAILRFAGAWAALILRLRPAGLRFGVFIKKALFRVL